MVVQPIAEIVCTIQDMQDRHKQGEAYHLVIAVQKMFTTSGDVMLRIFTVPSYFDPERDVLHLGNLKLLKLYDFWIKAHEAYYRITTCEELRSIDDIVGKRFVIDSAGGRIIFMREICENFNNIQKVHCLKYEDIVSNYISRPLGIRIIGPHIVLAFSEHMYVLSRCNYQNADIEYYLGRIRGFLIGASVKLFYNALEKLKHMSLLGKFSQRKISLTVDLVLPVYSSASS